MVDRGEQWKEFASHRASQENTPKRALVVGCAANVWEDVEASFKICDYHAIYCVKQAGIYWPGKFEFFVTLHPEVIDGYEIQRHKLGLPDGYQIVAPPPGELGMHGAKGNIARRVSYLWPDQETNDSASSGIYGAKVALDDGFDRIVLAGIPMSKEGGHFQPDSKTVHGIVRGSTWTGCAAFDAGFNKAVPHLIGKVKSMSGNTKKVLGAPSAEWIANGNC